MKFKDLEEGKSCWVYLEDIRQEELGETTSAEIGGVRCTFYNGISVESVEVIPEREKVTIPKVVADFINGQKNLEHGVLGALEEAHFFTKPDVSNWLKRVENQEKFLKAWIYGYEIDKEPLYWVRNKNELSLLKRESNGYINTSIGVPKRDQELNKKSYAFTEKEIKDYDERFFAFAAPVEELENEG